MKNSKKILIVASEFPPQPGGIGNHAVNLATQLKRKNFDVTVLTDYRSRNKSIENNFDSDLSFKTIRITRYRLIFKTYFRRLIEYKKYLKKEKPAIIIASGKFPMWLVAFWKTKIELKKVAVIHGSEVNMKLSWQKKIVDKALLKFNRIVAVSNYTKSLVNELNLSNIRVIPNGFEKEKFCNYEKEEFLNGFPNLITVGNVSKRKGQHNVIKKLPELIKYYPQLMYHIVGIPSEAEILKKMIVELNIEEHVILYGVLSQKKLNNLLCCSDIFVMLSEQTDDGDVEGFGIAILEANFMGLPAIGSKGCGIEDAINNHKSGILINYDEANEFRSAINEILKNRDSFIEESKKWANNHSWDLIVDKYLEYIN